MLSMHGLPKHTGSTMVYRSSKEHACRGGSSAFVTSECSGCMSQQCLTQQYMTQQCMTQHVADGWISSVLHQIGERHNCQRRSVVCNQHKPLR
jgi:hypothetical protein